MQLLDQIRLTNLTALARQHFSPDLTDTEIRILRDSASSQELDESSPSPNPANRPHVRASFLRWLITDPEAIKHLDAAGFRIYDVAIDGQLDLDECRSPFTLYLSHCTLTDSIDLRDSEFHAFCLRSSTLHADLLGDRSVFHGPILFLDSELTGDVNLCGVQVKGDIDFRNARLLNPQKTLRIVSSNIEGNIFFNQEFQGTTAILINSSHLGGTLDCTNATIRSLVVVNTRIEGSINWTDIRPPNTAELRLLDVQCQTFTDDFPSWPAPGNLSIDGLHYQNLTLTPAARRTPATTAGPPPPVTENPPDSARTRLRWLHRQSPEDLLRPGPWLQLADFYRRQGDDYAARFLLFRLASLQARTSWWPLSWFRISVAALERDPAYVLISVALLLAIGSAVFGYAGATHSMAPTEKEAYAAWHCLSPLPPTYPVIYTLEIELPLVKLGQDDKWAPTPNHGVASQAPSPSRPAPQIPSQVLATLRWIFILIGWLQAAALGAAVSRRFKS